MRSRFMTSLVALGILVAIPTAVRGEPTFVVKGGVSWSQLRSDEAGLFGARDSRRRLGFVLGVGTEVMLAGPVSLRPELLYVQRGEVLERPRAAARGLPGPLDSLVADELRLETGSLDVPLLVTLRPLGRGTTSPSLYLGPTVSVLLDATYEVAIGDRTEEFDADEQFRDLDVGLTLGAGLDFGPDGSFLLDLRHVRGLREVDVSGAGQRWGATMFMAGIRF